MNTFALSQRRGTRQPAITWIVWLCLIVISAIIWVSHEIIDGFRWLGKELVALWRLLREEDEPQPGEFLRVVWR